ncbi:hypothetical protein MP638_000955 [Amoeboaphelidium occidentale]|nr:hypothetical protein MP638_000955 [Amoeboaphelidium occidentale]
MVEYFMPPEDRLIIHKPTKTILNVKVLYHDEYTERVFSSDSITEQDLEHIQSVVLAFASDRTAHQDLFKFGKIMVRCRKAEWTRDQAEQFFYFETNIIEPKMTLFQSIFAPQTPGELVKESVPLKTDKKMSVFEIEYEQ